MNQSLSIKLLLAFALSAFVTAGAQKIKNGPDAVQKVCRVQETTQIKGRGSDRLPNTVSNVKIHDSFWSPKFRVWNDVTVKDVLNKFEGRHTDRPAENSAVANFAKVAEGQRGTHNHFGPPWFDGLIYETIRGVADYLTMFPDPAVEARIDAYIDTIMAAQNTEPSGYLETYTLLDEPEHRWGENGGLLRWQHEIYNAGMLVEAGVHYYKATGKAKLLEASTRLANRMVQVMGPAPKKNLVPSHSGPEEALVKLYWLYRDDPTAKWKVNVPVNEEDYLALTEFWLEQRGHHCGYPHWLEWGNPAAEKWIRDNKYADLKYGGHSRASWGDYAQDSIPVFEQQTIEGHAVRAALMCTGLATAALENRDPRYIEAATRLWDNMAGRRMFITGGVGAIYEDEKFGPDYYLPPMAYLETCAAVGAAFFSERMNEITHDAKYMDEVERVLYNSLLTAVSLKGDNYTYVNPLNAEKHNRWEWHGCPCCPPMFLKITSEIPQYIYGTDGPVAYVNLFIGSDADLNLDGRRVHFSQTTGYPWKETVKIAVDPEEEGEFAVKVRVPGWAQGIENPYGLYTSNLKGKVALKVNGSEMPLEIADGYATITRRWKKGDSIELTLPMEPRIISADPQAREIAGTVCVASGPVIYAFEDTDNPQLASLGIDPEETLTMTHNDGLLKGVNTIKSAGGAVAIPYYSIANRRRNSSHKVWVPRK